MEMKINPGVSGFPEVKVLEFRPGYIKSRSEYSNGFIFISEISGEKITVDSNFNLIQEEDGSFKPNFDSPNTNFVDVD